MSSPNAAQRAVSVPASKTASTLGEAVALHQAGLLVDAERAYQSVLQAAPTNFDAAGINVRADVTIVYLAAP